MVKRALLIGCNYPNGAAPLDGCVNDVFNAKSYLEDCYGFQDFKILVDTGESELEPTGKNIREQLEDLVSKSHSDDILFVHYSGHGTQEPSTNLAEADGKDEAIVPTDDNLIFDDDLREILSNLESGVKFTFVADCCRSGTLLDSLEIQIGGPKNQDSTMTEDWNGMNVYRGIDETERSANRLLNRSLPTEKLFQSLSKKSGIDVNSGNVKKVLYDLFGNAASLKVLRDVHANGGDAYKQETDNSSRSSQTNSKKRSGYSYNGGNGGYRSSATSPRQQSDADLRVLITAGEAHQDVMDIPSFFGYRGQACGLFSSLLEVAIRTRFDKYPDKILTNEDLVHFVRATLLQLYEPQNPCLECSSKDAKRAFITFES